MAQNKLPAMIIVATYSDPIQAQAAESAEILRHKATVFNIHDPFKFPSTIAKKAKK